jgi:tyrosine-protein phosphatase YwqE
MPLPLHAVAYKIIVHTTKTLPEGRIVQERLKKKLESDSTFKKLQDKSSFVINCRESGKYCIVTLEPINNTKVLKKLLKIVRTIQKDAFINKYTPPTPIQKAITPIKKIKEPVKPLHIKKRQEKKEKKLLIIQKEYALSFVYFIILILSLSLLLFWIFIKKSRKNIHTNIDKNLLHINNNNEKSLLVDIQAHILPGIDQNYCPDSMDEAIDIIKELQSLGYKKIITTPVMLQNDIHVNASLILNALTGIKKVLQENHINITIDIAALYKLNDTLDELLKQKKISTFDKDYIIVEAAVDLDYELFKKYINNIINSHYKIILAHPENYIFLHHNLERYQEIKKLGIFFELDINSLSTTHPNKEIQHHARRLIENGMIDFLGSNVHKLYHIDRIKSIQETDSYKNIFKTNTILNNYLY